MQGRTPREAAKGTMIRANRAYPARRFNRNTYLREIPKASDEISSHTDFLAWTSCAQRSPEVRQRFLVLRTVKEKVDTPTGQGTLMQSQKLTCNRFPHPLFGSYADFPGKSSHGDQPIPYFKAAKMSFSQPDHPFISMARFMIPTILRENISVSSKSCA